MSCCPPNSGPNPSPDWAWQTEGCLETEHINTPSVSKIPLVNARRTSHPILPDLDRGNCSGDGSLCVNNVDLSNRGKPQKRAFLTRGGENFLEFPIGPSNEGPSLQINNPNLSISGNSLLYTIGHRLFGYKPVESIAAEVHLESKVATIIRTRAGLNKESFAVLFQKSSCNGRSNFDTYSLRVSHNGANLTIASCCEVPECDRYQSITLSERTQIDWSSDGKFLFFSGTYQNKHGGDPTAHDAIRAVSPINSGLTVHEVLKVKTPSNTAAPTITGLSVAFPGQANTYRVLLTTPIGNLGPNGGYDSFVRCQDPSRCSYPYFFDWTVPDN